MIQTGVVRIGNDPAIRSTNNGDQVLELSLAYDYGRKGDDGKKPTQWIYASLWGTRAEKLKPYLKKGSQIFVVLSDVHMQTYEKKDGSGQATSMRARIEQVELLGGPREQSQHERDKANGYQKEPKSSLDGLDDDIPF
jgi:single-strand DNA-binding protein